MKFSLLINLKNADNNWHFHIFNREILMLTMFSKKKIKIVKFEIYKQEKLSCSNKLRMKK